MTKRERNRKYREALDWVQRSTYNPICPVLRRMDETLYDIRTEYPEFYYQKPKNKTIYDYWFSFSKRGQKKRIEILKNCIKQTKNVNDDND